MRLLVLDGSSVLKSLVCRLVPEGVEVETAATFDEACNRIELDPPDAIIVNVSPADLPWNGIQSLCHCHTPPIPVLWESSIWASPEEAGLEDLDAESHFLSKPYPLSQLRAEIARLLLLAEADPLHLDEGRRGETLH